MEIRKLNTPKEFEETIKFQTLAVWTFGPLSDFDEDDDGTQILVAIVNGQAVAYLIADGTDLWHIETAEGHTGNGYARQLAEAAGIRYAYEVCSDEGAEFCEALGIEWEDCRD
jgi:hypothetical protein